VRRAKLQGGALARRTRLVRPAAGGRGKLSHPAQSSGLLRPNHRVSLWPIGSDQLYKRKEASGTQASKKIETSLGFPFESTTSSEERQGEFRRSSHALLLVGSGQGIRRLSGRDTSDADEVDAQWRRSYRTCGMGAGRSCRTEARTRRLVKKRLGSILRDLAGRLSFYRVPS
jgi:hypothetical protein